MADFLATLRDVNLAGLADGSVVYWDATAKQWKAAAHAWTAYTPTLNNQSLGTGGSATGGFRYDPAMKTVRFRAAFTFGTAPGTPTSSVWISAASLPVPFAGAAASACVGVHAAGSSDFAPSNPIMIHGRVRAISGAFGCNLFRSNTDAELSAANTNYAPASGDVLTVTGEYEPA